LTGDGKPFRPAATSQMTVSEYDGRFSSDGRWLAYFSYESSRPEVYIVPFAAEAKTQVSTTGGWNTIFSRNNELFFVTMGDRLMARTRSRNPVFASPPSHLYSSSISPTSSASATTSVPTPNSSLSKPPTTPNPRPSRC
jgi:hypothetical protein